MQKFFFEILVQTAFWRNLKTTPKSELLSFTILYKKIHILDVNQFIFFVQCVEARPLNRPSFRLPVLGHKKPRSLDCWVGWVVGRENQNKEDRTILSLSWAGGMSWKFWLRESTVT